jgi:catechol 2,3-dioxygenase-like lactoylglutathione lyase family enzyme
MDQRISLVTLGVRDLARARAFYLDGLGWTASGASNEAVTFIQMNGVALGLWSRESLAEDAGVADTDATFSGVSIAYNARDRAEVDRVLARAEAAGGRIVQPAREVFWGGYSGYFTDPDGHLWEVAWNPFWEVTEDGRVVLPE